MKEWNVEIKFKNSESSEYVYEGSQSEARTDAYASFPVGSIKQVIITPYLVEE